MTNVLHKVTQTVDRVMDWIASVGDYFYLLKTVTLSEWVLLWIAVTHSFWLVMFDLSASAPFYQYVYSEVIWGFAFGIAVSFHLFGLIKRSWFARYIACRGYSALWFVWFWAVGAHHLNNPVAPRLLIFCVLSVIVSVKVGKTYHQLKALNGRI